MDKDDTVKELAAVTIVNVIDSGFVYALEIWRSEK